MAARTLLSLSLFVAALVGPVAAQAASYQTILGGFYSDPNHYKPGSLEGIRLLGFPNAGEDFAFTGTDDGQTFWRVGGKVLDASGFPNGPVKLTANFAEKGGPPDFVGTYLPQNGGAIVWQDNNKWVQQKEAMLNFATQPAADRFSQGMVSGFILACFVGGLLFWRMKSGGPRSGLD
ncbi:unnamed protein product [Amoebophrya sp. A25]|nr:unnamed protein product [Amoebophrya sp. A25]|eukprot:GSA25T00018416001.1